MTFEDAIREILDEPRGIAYRVVNPLGAVRRNTIGFPTVEEIGAGGDEWPDRLGVSPSDQTADDWVAAVEEVV